MANMSLDDPWTFAFGILGNIISFMVYLSPIPTFYRVYRMRSTEGFQSVPYVVALFSSMLWIYYALVKTDSVLLITINSFGCFIETIYIAMYLIYAARSARVFTIQIFFLLNVLSFCCVILITQLLSHGDNRVQVLGWICVGFSISVFLAPLSIIRVVMRTKSVEYMPFSLSLFLTLSAVAWFAYGISTKDLYVQVPNILGFGFGLTQMLLYVVISMRKRPAVNLTIPEHVITIVPIDSAPESELGGLALECHESNCLEDKANKEANKGTAAAEEEPQEMKSYA